MLIEVYQMTAAENTVSITLEAVCDAFSSFLWDIEYFQCGQFELYIAATPETVAKLRAWLDKTQGQRLPYAKTAALFPAYTPDVTAQTLADSIEKESL